MGEFSVNVPDLHSRALGRIHELLSEKVGPIFREIKPAICLTAPQPPPLQARTAPRQRQAPDESELACLRHERNAAEAAAQSATTALSNLQRQHAAAALEHVCSAAAAERRAAAAETEAAAASAAAERAAVVQLEMQADVRDLRLKNEMLSAQLAVLMEAFQVLEAETWGSNGRTAELLPFNVPSADPAPDAADVGAPPLRWDAPLSPPLQPSLMNLALTAAELRCQLGRSEAKAQAAHAAATAAQEQAASLRLLLARQGTLAAGSSTLLARVEAAEGQLAEAQGMGAELKRELERRDRQLRVVLEENTRLHAEFAELSASVASLRFTS